MGLTVLDAGIVIAALDASDAHHEAALDALRDARARGDAFLVPASAYAEVLVGPSRRGADAVATVDAFLDALAATVEPASREIARAAAALRAEHGRGLRLPDVLVLATGAVAGADLVLTTDAGWPATGRTVHVGGGA
ncbi:MAG TPA: type II toxin-antitoxin system VapC family toxin [Candidatus Limnocylindrales bacterium]